MTVPVFLVEDDPSLRENLILVLSSLGNAQVVATAETEQEARDWLQHHAGEWRCTVLDLFLKRGTGFGVLAAMASTADRQRVVVLTNSATPANRALCRQLGVGAVFDKTYQLSEFLDYFSQVNGADRTTH